MSKKMAKRQNNACIIYVCTCLYVHAYVFSVASFIFLIDTFGNYHKYKWEYTVNVPTQYPNIYHYVFLLTCGHLMTLERGSKLVNINEYHFPVFFC